MLNTSLMFDWNKVLMRLPEADLWDRTVNNLGLQLREFHFQPETV